MVVEVNQMFENDRFGLDVRVSVADVILESLPCEKVLENAEIFDLVHY